MADDSRLSSLIDDDGRLFGLVNIVDALVFLLVLAVLVAGIALLTGGDSSQQEPRFVTVDVGSQPEYIAEQVTVGDEWNPTQTGSFVITDVYRAPVADDGEGTRLLIRAQINGTPIQTGNETTEQQRPDPISFLGEPLRFGTELTVETNAYALSGIVTGISQTGTDLPTQSRGFVIETTVDRSTADRIGVGDRFVSGGTEQLRVETVTVYPTVQNDLRRVVVGVIAQTRVDSGVTVYGDQPVRTGATISLRTNSYGITGDIVTVGGPGPPGTQGSQTVTMKIDDITPERATVITTGVTEQSQDITTAQVLSKTEQPATEVVRTDNGFRTLEHPTRLELTLTVELSVREFQDGRVQFRGEPLRVGQTLGLLLDGTVFEGRVVDIG